MINPTWGVLLGFLGVVIVSHNEVALANRGDLLSQRPNALELESLPPFCNARLNGDESLQKLWSQKIGRDNFLHVHHFCFGLNLNRRALITFDKKQKRYYLERAVANFDYVLKHWPADSPMRSEATAGKAQAERMLQSVKSGR